MAEAKIDDQMDNILLQTFSLISNDLSDKEFESFWPQILVHLGKKQCIEILNHHFSNNKSQQQSDDLKQLVHTMKSIEYNRSDILKWLKSITLNHDYKQYHRKFTENGIMNMSQLKGIKLTDLWFIDNITDRVLLLFHCNKLTKDWIFLMQISEAKQKLGTLDIDFIYDDEQELILQKFRFWLFWQVGLPQYYKLFEKSNEYRISSLILMNDEKLQTLGIDKESHRKHILNSIAKLKASKAKSFLDNMKSMIHKMDNIYTELLQQEDNQFLIQYKQNKVNKIHQSGIGNNYGQNEQKYDHDYDGMGAIISDEEKDNDDEVQLQLLSEESEIKESQSAQVKIWFNKIDKKCPKFTEGF